MLKRIHIKGYKSLRDVEVSLEPLTVLVGPNASGKSNFLDALQLLSMLATSRTVKEAFDPPYRGKPLESFAFGPGGLPEALRKERLSFLIEADLQLSDRVVADVDKLVDDMRRPNPPTSPPSADGEARGTHVRERNLRYRIEIEMVPSTGVLRVADEYLAALNSKGSPTTKRKPFIERNGDKLQLRLEGQGHPTYFDRYLDRSILSLAHYPPHYPHLLAARRELESWLFFYFEPRERMRSAAPIKEVRHIGLMGEDLAAFLNTMQAMEPRQFHAVERALRLVLPSFEKIKVDISALGEAEISLVENGVAIPARLLSEGTLRVLGLLALVGVKETPSVVGFEEPENGIHPRRIQAIANLLNSRAEGDTQYIVTTHSPTLTDLVEDHRLFVVSRKAGATSIEPFAAWGPLGRRSATDEALTDQGDDLLGREHLPVSERILRGDLDA